jgi:hypothetical protein
MEAAKSELLHAMRRSLVSFSFISPSIDLYCSKGKKEAVAGPEVVITLLKS